MRRATFASSRNCNRTAERLSDYLEHELEDRQLRRVRRHLDRCGRCRSVVASLARTIELLQKLGRGGANDSPSLAEAVSSRVRRDLSSVKGQSE